jgi:hypothetical protein
MTSSPTTMSIYIAARIRVKAYISGTKQDRQKIPTDLSSLGSRLGCEEIWSSLNDEKCALLKRAQKLLDSNIFIHIHFKNK